MRLSFFLGLLWPCLLLGAQELHASGAELSERARKEAKADSWNPPRFWVGSGDYERLSSNRERHRSFVEGIKVHYGPLIEYVAQQERLPSVLLMAVIANEQVFYSHPEHFAERFGAGASVGLAQIQPATLHAHGFYRSIPKNRLAKRLKSNSLNIYAAGKLLRHHLRTLCISLSWRELGLVARPSASESFVADVLEGEDVCTAKSVCTLLQEEPKEMDRLLREDSDLGHCMMKASVAFWISGDTIVYRREIRERRPNTMKRSADGASLLKDFLELYSFALCSK